MLDYTKYKQRIFTPEEEFEQYQYQLKQDYQRIQQRVQPDTHLSPKRFEQIIETYYTKKLFSKRFLARSSIQRFDIPSQEQIRSTPRSVTASRARSHSTDRGGQNSTIRRPRTSEIIDKCNQIIEPQRPKLKVKVQMFEKPYQIIHSPKKTFDNNLRRRQHIKNRQFLDKLESNIKEITRILQQQ